MTLNIFVDESGDFNKQDNSELYVVSLVFHNQDDDIKSEVTMHKKLLDGFPFSGTIHIANVVNNNKEGKSIGDMDARRNYYKSMNVICNRLKIKQRSIIVDKRYTDTTEKTIKKVAEELSLFVQSQSEFLKSYRKINVYYDNGQPLLKGLLFAVFAAFKPDYPLFSIKSKLLPHIADFLTFQEKIIYIHQSKTHSMNKNIINFYTEKNYSVSNVMRNIKKDLSKKRIK